MSCIADAITVASTQDLGFAQFLIRCSFCTYNNHLAIVSDALSDASSSTGVLSISAGGMPINAIASPPVRSKSYRAPSRTITKKKRRTRRRSLTSESEDGEDNSIVGNGGDDLFGGSGNGGNNGRGWNFGRYGGSNWEESHSSSGDDPAFGIVYEVLCWIALSNCMQFIFEKINRIVADGLGDPSRQKVSMRFAAF